MPKRKQTKKKARRKKEKSGRIGFAGWLFRGLIICILAICALVGIYTFSSFETRERIEGIVLRVIEAPRVHPATPSPVARFLDSVKDLNPSSTGLTVEGGELGYDPATPYLAGRPRHRGPASIQEETEFAALSFASGQQIHCLRFSPKQSANEQARLSKRALEALETTGSHPDWERALRLATARYPRRFGDVWIYFGLTESPSPTDPAAPALFIIALDLNEAGGLRALSLLIPAQDQPTRFSDHITSISAIETLTGTNFLPELELSIQYTLKTHTSPQLW